MKKLLSFFLTISCYTVNSQNYAVQGNAVIFSGCNCFKLTDAVGGQGGAAYQNQTINLNNSFDFTFDLFFGCRDAGADGIVFVLTNNITGLGQSGGGLGYGGLAGNSFAVEFDTYQNGGEPGPDHIAFESGGSVAHNVAGPVSANSGSANIEDCAYHTVRIVWDVNTNTFSVYFDGALRLSQVFPSFVATYFGGNPIVNWGFSASTGGENNEQRFCVISNSNWTAGINFQSCSTTVQFTDISTSNIGSVASWAWTFGDGTTSTLQNPTHTYANNGVYSVSLTITDNSGCTNSFTKDITINPPINLTGTLTQPLCNGGNNGEIALNATGGFGLSAGYGGYQYSVNGGSPTFTPNVIGLTSGNYSISVTDGVCSATQLFNLGQPTALSASVTKTDASCNLANGSATINVSGGTTPYQFVNWPPVSATNVATGLFAGTYIPDFRDANGCSALLQYRADIINLPCGLSSSVSSNNVSCFNGSNGSATLNVTGGAAGGNITWNPGGLTGATVNGLSAGTYTYNYNDNNPSNTFSGTVTITQPGAGMVADIVAINMSCNNTNDGSALASVLSGGNPNYSYSWSAVGQGNNAQANNLGVGPISVTITDSRGCTATATSNVSAPPLLALNITSINDSCFQSNKGNATAIVSGGNGGYLYEWNNGDPGATSYNLGEGSYTVTSTDSKGCSVSGSITITEAFALNVIVNNTDVACFGESTASISLTPSGGTGAFNYSWNPNNLSGNNPTNIAAGNYYFSVTDINNCLYSDSIVITQPNTALLASSTVTNVSCYGANDGTLSLNVSGGSPNYSFLGNVLLPGNTTISALPPGIYADTIQDANGCLFSISDTITEPGVQSINIVSVNNPCFGASLGSALATFVNATGTVDYRWSNSFNNAVINNLLPGTYRVSAADANGCLQVDSTLITEPNMIPLVVSATNALCFNGNGSATANPLGNDPFNIIWSNNQSGITISLQAGTYSATSTDSIGCIQIADSFTITMPTSIAIQNQINNLLCFGDNNGAIYIQVSGGTGNNYNYAWLPNVSLVDSAVNLTAGSYLVSVSDSNNCSISDTFIITQPDDLTLTASNINISCNTLADGQITINTIGGSPTYSYVLFNNNQALQNNANGIFNSLIAGGYSVVVSDINNCADSINVTLTEPSILTANVVYNDQSCFDKTDGNVTIAAIGGTADYTYFLNTSSNNIGGFENLEAGSYLFTVTDNNNCSYIDSFSIQKPDSIYVSIIPDTAKINLGDELPLETNTNATGSITYIWQPSEGLSCYNCASPIFNGFSSTTYTLSLINENGCTTEDIIDIEVKNNYGLFAPNAFTPNNDLTNDKWGVLVNQKIIKDMKVSIFNRWGEKVFNGTKSNYQWDGYYLGKLQLPGVYVYQVEATFIDDNVKKLKGTLTLIE